MNTRKGFTLIELLVVIAIIAILSVVVILTLNPAALLQQSRDSNRISDMSVLKSAISFYLASAPVVNLGTSEKCYESAGVGNATNTCTAWFTSQSAGTSTASSTGVGGSGWLPINFAGLSSGAPIGALPQDPLILSGTNDLVHIYTYISSSTTYSFKLDTHMESAKYSNGGSNDVCSTDGGSDNLSYEQGSNLSL